MLNAISLSGDKVEINEMPVLRTFGVQDLYLDLENPHNVQHIEELLGRLEGSAARVIHKIRDSFDKRAQSDNNQVTLTRVEKDILRKFLFVMRFRREGMKRDYQGKTIEDYPEHDKEKLAEYMQKGGFKKPLDVWLDSLKAIVEIKIDADVEKWQSELMQQIYLPFAQLFIFHLDYFYLALCTPSRAEDEFLLTENGFGIHERPVTITTNIVTKQSRALYTEYHIFAHMSPRLSMVPRRLPVTKARNSYTKIENGILIPLDGGRPSLQPNDKFFFKFFPISTEFMNKINCVSLEEGHSTSTIVFNRKQSAHRAIKYYLTLDGERGWKEISGDNDPRLIYLKKLGEASILLGQKVDVKYQSNKAKLFLGHSVLGNADQVFDLVNAMVNARKPLDREDFEQAAKMLKLRIKIDTWTKGLAEQQREDTRNNLRDMYCELPAQQVWIYMKRIRFMLTGGTILGWENNIEDSNLRAELLPGPEDVIAHMARMFTRPHHCRMIYYAALKSVHMADASFGLPKQFALDAEGAKRLQQEKRVALGSQGSICDCGMYCSIPDKSASYTKPNQRVLHIEEAARKVRNSFQIKGLPDLSSLGHIINRILTPDEAIEVATRLEVEGLFRGQLKSDFDDSSMGELLDVLFQVVFPPFALKRK
ncbi:hypothetical protein MMC13_000222 [Lambiella insularis]|nr:hypothetical protein [Lambiella insularis]